MSEYQYHEWQTLERPLTAAEQNAIDELSSHIDVTSTQANVTYHWSDFKHDLIEVLAKYFDAYLYLTNWGTRLLAFRFQQGLVDVHVIEAYSDEYHLNIKTISGVQILQFEMDEEDGYEEWIEERGLLSTLARLRDDIILGDYRALYLAWLKAMSLESGGYEEDEDDPENFFNNLEPSLPAGLKQLTPSLKALIDFFEIDPFLVLAAAERSPSQPPAKQIDFAPLVSRLTRQECEEFLLKVVNAEPGAVAALRKKLLSFEAAKQGVQESPRTFGELIKLAEVLRQAEAKHRAEEKRKKHITEMQELAKREAQIWQDIEKTLEKGYTARIYDEATASLSKLYQLAEFQGAQDRFYLRLQTLAEKYKARSALMRRWKSRGWV